VKKWNGLIDPNETLPHVDVNMQGQGGYHYLFDLTANPALGFGIEGAIELRLPGLPSNFLADTSFAGNQKFVTAERAFKLLNIHKVDVK